MSRSYCQLHESSGVQACLTGEPSGTDCFFGLVQSKPSSAELGGDLLATGGQTVWSEGPDRALASAIVRMRLDASLLHLPPTSIPRTTTQRLLLCKGFGYVLSLFLRAFCRAAELLLHSSLRMTSPRTP